MSRELSRGFAYQPNEPTPDKPCEILMGISFEGVNYIDVEDYKKLQETLKNTYETGQEIACELEKENQQLKNDLEFVLEQVLGAFIQNWCIDWNFADIREKYSIDNDYDWKESNE